MYKIESFESSHNCDIAKFVKPFFFCFFFLIYDFMWFLLSTNWFFVGFLYRKINNFGYSIATQILISYLLSCLGLLIMSMDNESFIWIEFLFFFFETSCNLLNIIVNYHYIHDNVHFNFKQTFFSIDYKCLFQFYLFMIVFLLLLLF